MFVGAGVVATGDGLPDTAGALETPGVVGAIVGATIGTTVGGSVGAIVDCAGGTVGGGVGAGVVTLAATTFTVPCIDGWIAQW